MDPASPLKRDISKFGLLLISFAAIFGSGWLFAPYYAAQVAGPAAIFAWLMGGVMSAVIGLTMAEVVALFPKTGGLNQVAVLTHGQIVSYLVSIFTLLVCVVLPVVEVRAVLQYLGSYFQSLFNPDGTVSGVGFCAACFLLALVSGANFFGSKITSYLTNFSVGIKISIPLLICSVFLWQIYSSGESRSFILEIPSEFKWSDLFLAISTSGIIFSFNGFNQATIFAGEAKNPQKSVPFAILGSLGLTTALYLFIQYVFLISVPKSLLVNGWKNFSFPGDSGPFAGLAMILGIHWLLTVIYTDAIISPMGTAFTYASAAPRMFYSLSETGKVFPGLTRLNRYQVPVNSIALSYVLGVIAFLFFGSLKAMITILVAAFVLCYTVAPASLLALRKIRPELDRPFRVWAPFLICYLSMVFSNLMVFCCGWEALRNLMIATTIPSGIGAFVLRRKSGKFWVHLRGCLWFVLQVLVLAGLAYLYDHGQLGFGEAAVGVAILSGFALFLSQIERNKTL